ncbi:alpha-1,3-glucanase/mutanase [Diaporthe helianthi]|uniref:Alpha-1,3-glucanase/mutanase n=1 Tax=Diaporthe helianthi TaxID=158607 RepID=A0A2P5I9K3_DIAHE|nr:alpha-1,3-glucanase/mutanase [Diaporthe helianthi]
MPFVGEAGFAASGSVNIARAIALAGLTGNAALDTFSLVTHEGDPVMSIFGLLFGVGGVAALEREAASYARMGKMRRDTDPEEIARLGDSVHEQAMSVQKIVRSCNL